MFELFASSLRLAAPLLFASMGGLLCERAGIATVCLEGVMLFAALISATATLHFESPFIGMCLGMAVGGFVMSLHAFLTVVAKSDRIISGVAVNILAAGITPLLCKLWFDSPTNTQSLSLAMRLPGLPIIGFAIVLPFLLHFGLQKTRYGVWLMSAGDGPNALATSGISVAKVRIVSLFLGGILASFGGIYLATSHASQFTRDMTSGRGFIALAALIFGKWRPIPTFFACLFFGLTDALQIRLQSEQWGGIQIPVQALQALPYVVTLLVLVGLVGTSNPPSAIVKGE